MKNRTLSILLLSLLLPLVANAQLTAPTELSGVRFASNTVIAVDSNARFAIGLTTDGGTTYSTTARVTDTVKIVGRVRPEASHVGLTGDLFVVDQVNGAWTMRNTDGVFLPWDFNVAHLVPYKQNVTLTADLPVDVYSGELGLSGDHRVYIGYKPANGSLYYTPVPQKLSVTSLTATDQAYNLFVSKISPNIIQTRCILCHVAGGLAQTVGAYHIFLQPLASNLPANFKTMQGLVSARGVTYIMTKVAGGNSHGGGVQLTANSADYNDLQTFLNLVAQDVIDTSTSNMQGQSTGGGDMTIYTNPYASPY